ncbi:hypothetical protein Y032_0669g1360 [Ancylostoma ceylanicum]|nr:hypothetical protein Y032_0669g1360 [Ancylostoma ceylanicum]
MFCFFFWVVQLSYIFNFYRISHLWCFVGSSFMCRAELYACDILSAEYYTGRILYTTPEVGLETLERTCSP